MKTRTVSASADESQAPRSSRRIGVLVAITATLASGCAGINQANHFGNPLAPPSPIARNVVLKWEKELAETDVTAISTRRERNDLVYRLIFMSDYHFQRYEADLLLGRAARDTAVELSMFGLNAASTLMTPGSSTQVLSAIAGGLGFSRATVEKNFYMNHTAPVLMAKMRALRSEKLNEIVRNLRRSIDTYPASLAIIDVLDYYNRGTMLGALNAISNDIATQAIKAEGGKVTEPEKAPPVSLQIKTGMIAAPSSDVASTVASRGVARSAGSDLARRRRALGSAVNEMRRERDGARAVTILQSADVPAAESEAIGILGGMVNNIDNKTELTAWEKAFAVAPSKKSPVKTAPPVISDPIESIDSKTPPVTPIPKTAPPVVKDKSGAEPL